MKHNNINSEPAEKKKIILFLSPGDKGKQTLGTTLSAQSPQFIHTTTSLPCCFALFPSIIEQMRLA